ncbi:uncharacterized protein isoform X1 [Rhodnius prolixus]|uniref:uncharacterized protein isoform X1 n=1 Tax=Rhodnius prolixus TaxID=13249 RepID=UPI003D18E6AE
MTDDNASQKSEYVDPKSLPPILETNPQNEFNFLENFVRRLICQLIDMQERKRAANWFKFLKKNEKEPMAVNFLLILMLALTRKKLVKPFDVQPPSSFEPLGKLKDFVFPLEISAWRSQIAPEAVGVCNRKLSETPKRPTPREHTQTISFIQFRRQFSRYLLEQYNNYPRIVQSKFPMNVSYSDDFKQYGCVQDLGGKGVHCFCAYSSEPVTIWDNSEHLKHFNLQQSANYLAYKMSLIEDKISEVNQKSSQSLEGVPENFIHYIASMKKFRMPYIGRLHVKGIPSALPKPKCLPN